MLENGDEKTNIIKVVKSVYFTKNEKQMKRRKKKQRKLNDSKFIIKWLRFYNVVHPVKKCYKAINETNKYAIF
jgi:hypothetical protein